LYNIEVPERLGVSSEVALPPQGEKRSGLVGALLDVFLLEEAREVGALEAE